MGIGIVFKNMLDMENVSLPIVRQEKSNNIAELMAIKVALEKLYEKGHNSIPIRINTDSQYSIDA